MSHFGKALGSRSRGRSVSRSRHTAWKMSDLSLRTGQNIRRGKKNEGQVFGDELLNSIIKPLPLLVVQRDHLLLHQLINFSLPIAGGLRFSEMPQMRAPPRKPYIHLRIGIRITAAQAHDGCFVIKTLEYAIEHRAKIERHNMNLHAQMR